MKNTLVTFFFALLAHSCQTLHAQTLVRPKLHLLSIGISRVGPAAKDSVPELKWARKDAEDVYYAWERQTKQPERLYDAGKFVLLTNEKATKNGILDSIQKFTKSCGANDLFVLHYSGHGQQLWDGKTQQFFLIPYDSDPLNLIESNLERDVLFEYLKDIQSSKVLMFDACHSAGFAKQGEVTRAFSQKAAMDFTKAMSQPDKNCIIFAGSASDQRAWELPTMKNGLLTHVLMSAFNGTVIQTEKYGKLTVDQLFEDGYVSVNELDNYLNKGLSGLSDQLLGKEREASQGMFSLRAMFGDFPLFRLDSIVPVGLQPSVPISVRINADKPFELGATEVTAAEFCVFLNDSLLIAVENRDWINLSSANCPFEYTNGYYRPKLGKHLYPAVSLSYLGAEAYCKWLARKTGQPFRLPTEEEWAFVAKNNPPSETTTWHNANSGPQLHPVKSKGALPYGLYDFWGNAAEWCTGTVDGEINKMPILGGASNNDFDKMTPTTRRPERKTKASDWVGFRVAKSR